MQMSRSNIKWLIIILVIRIVDIVIMIRESFGWLFMCAKQTFEIGFVSHKYSDLISF